MRTFTPLVLASLGTVVNAAAIPDPQPQPQPEVRQTLQIDYDTIIVGGGPAGLAALSGLARVRRNAFLIDSADYRNGPTRHMHDVLGFDGVTPAYFRYAARAQLSHYNTVSWTNGTVVKITQGDATQTPYAYFTVSYTPGLSSPPSSPTQITARKVVLATGLRDILPSTPGLQENWGSGIYWCPWCDGHEHADQSMGLLGTLDNVPGNVREILTLNKDIVAYVNGSDTPAFRALTTQKFPGWEKYLSVHNVRVDNRTISAITRLKNGGDAHHDPSLPSAPEYDLFNITFTDGGSEERAAFFTSFPAEQASSVGQEAGVAPYGNRLAVDPTRGLVTNVPGIYAVGDANSDNVTNVPHALFSGKRTAVYLHVQLAREEAEKDINGTTAVSGRDLTVASEKLDVEVRSLWGLVNGRDRKDDILHAGEFDAY